MRLEQEVKVEVRMGTGVDKPKPAGSGPFWDAMEGRAALPPAAATLGMKFVSADVLQGTLELAFTARREWTNPSGNVLGAFVAAMLYDTVGPTLLATLAPDELQATLEMKTSFLRPVRPGRVIGKGRIVHRNGDLAYLDTTLATCPQDPVRCPSLGRLPEAGA